MAIVQMQKVAIIAHSSIKENLLETLHEAGILEIREARDTVRIDHTEVNFRSADLKFAIDTLKDVAPKETITIAGKKSKFEDIVKAAKHTDVLGTVEKLRKLEESDTQAEHDLQEARTLKDILAPWSALPYDLGTASETAHTIRILGTVPAINLPALKEALNKNLPRTVFESYESEKDIPCAAHVWKEDKDKFEERVTGFGWTSVELPTMEVELPNFLKTRNPAPNASDSSSISSDRQKNEQQKHFGAWGKPAMLREKAVLREKEILQRKAKNHEERVQISIELPQLVKVAIFMKWLDEKQSVREAMSETESTFTLLAWMPKKEIVSLDKKLNELSPAIAMLKVKADEGEEPPVLLKNSKLITPFESVTNLYGLPLFTEMDPTKALSPFFILYFALCLTDAGYGAIIALIFGIVIWRKKLSIEQARLVWLLFIGGIVTFFVSIPFGGWLGFAPEQVPAILTKQTASGLMFRGQVWNLNAEQGITFLQTLALFLGVTHLFFGMFLAGWYKWIHGRKIEALWMDFTSHLLLGAAIFYALAPAQFGDIKNYVLYAVLAIVVWGKGYGTKWFLRPLMGLLGLLNFSISMVSNSLSYLRILALGLVTGAIAAAVNQVAVEMGKLFPIWIGIPVIILIFLMGHLVSIALNTLGSFIHSGRLQFIEFFSQFFEGGGRGFKPFSRSTS